jgi:hypothetical protein
MNQVKRQGNETSEAWKKEVEGGKKSVRKGLRQRAYFIGVNVGLVWYVGKDYKKSWGHLWIIQSF